MEESAKDMMNDVWNYLELQVVRTCLYSELQYNVQETSCLFN